MTTPRRATITQHSLFCDVRTGGARASLTGAEATLWLRALRASGDLDDERQLHLAKQHERTHQPRYVSGVVPNPLPPARPHLTLVK